MGQAVTINSPAQGSSFDDRTAPIYSGTGTPDAVITIDQGLTTDPWAAMGTSKVNAAGEWAFQGQPLTAGLREARARQDVDNSCSMSTRFTVTKSVAVVNPVVISTPAVDARVSPTAFVTGTGDIGAEIEVWDGAGTYYIGEPVRVDGNGNWSLKPTSEFPIGNFSLYAVQTTLAGQSSGWEHRSFVVVADTAVTSPTGIGTPSDVTNITDMAITLDTPAAGAVLGEGTPTVYSGRGVAYATVTIEQRLTGEGWQVMGTTAADQAGAWSYKGAALTEGEREARAKQSLARSSQSEIISEPNAFLVGRALPRPFAVTHPAEGEQTLKTPVFGGTGEVGATVHVYKSGGDVFFGTATVGANGQWTLTHSLVIVTGNYTISAMEYPTTGGNSGWKDRTFVVVTDLPLVVTSPAEGARTSRTPVIAGTATVGAKVEVYKRNSSDVLGTAFAQDNGEWSLPLDRALEVGDFHISVRQYPPAGVVSDWSQHWFRVVDDQPEGTYTTVITIPIPPVITQPVRPQLWSLPEYSDSDVRRVYMHGQVGPWVSDVSINVRQDEGNFRLPAPYLINIHTYLVDTLSGEIVECIKYGQTYDTADPYSWSRYYADDLNAKGRRLKAGTWSNKRLKVVDTLKPGDNRIWHYGHGYHAFNTFPLRSNWVNALRLNDTAEVDKNTQLWVEVRDIRSQRLYERIEFDSAEAPGSWAKDLCTLVNKESQFIKAGAWSSSRGAWNAQLGFQGEDTGNSLWVPQSSDLAVTLSWSVDTSQSPEVPPVVPSAEEPAMPVLISSDWFRLSDKADLVELNAQKEPYGSDHGKAKLRVDSLLNYRMWIASSWGRNTAMTGDYSYSPYHLLRDRFPASLECFERLVWLFEIDEALMYTLNEGRGRLLFDAHVDCLEIEGEHLVPQVKLKNDYEGLLPEQDYKRDLLVYATSDGACISFAPAPGQEWKAGQYRFYFHLANSRTGGTIDVGDVALATETSPWVLLQHLTLRGHAPHPEYKPSGRLCEDFGNTMGSEIFDTEGEMESGVNPQTGLFHSHYPVATLYALGGREGRIDLTLHYSARRGNEAGLGDGWAFRFSSFEKRERRLTLSTGEVVLFTDQEWTQLEGTAVVKRPVCWVSSNADISVLTVVYPSGMKETLSGVKGEDNVEYSKNYIIQLQELIEKALGKELDIRSDINAAQRQTERELWVKAKSDILSGTPSQREAALKALPTGSVLATQLRDEFAKLSRPFGYLLPSAITYPQGGAFQLIWTCSNSQYLLSRVASEEVELFSATYADTQVDFKLWPGTALIDYDKSSKTFNKKPPTQAAKFNISLTLKNYLLQTISRSDISGVTAFGYAPDPTLDYILVRVENANGSIEQVHYVAKAMQFAQYTIPPLPAVAVYSVRDGRNLARVRYYEYSSWSKLVPVKDMPNVDVYLWGGVGTIVFEARNGATSYRYDKYRRLINSKTAVFGDLGRYSAGLLGPWGFYRVHRGYDPSGPDGSNQWVSKQTAWNYPDFSPKLLAYAQVSSIETRYAENNKQENTTQTFEYNSDGQLSKSVAADGAITEWYYYSREGGAVNAGLTGQKTTLKALDSLFCPTVPDLQAAPLACVYEYQIFDGVTVPLSLKFYGYIANASGMLESCASVVVNGVTRIGNALTLAAGRKSARVQTVISGLTTPERVNGKTTWTESSTTQVMWNGATSNILYAQKWSEDDAHRYKTIVLDDDGNKTTREDVEVYCRFSRQLLATTQQGQDPECFSWDSEGRRLAAGEQWYGEVNQQTLTIGAAKVERRYDSAGHLIRERVDGRLTEEAWYDNHGVLQLASEYEYLPGGLCRVNHSSSDDKGKLLVWQARLKKAAGVADEADEADAELEAVGVNGKTLTTRARKSTVNKDGTMILREARYQVGVTAARYKRQRTYDLEGRLIKEEDLLGKTAVTIDYDELDRVTGYTLADGTQIKRTYEGLTQKLTRLDLVTDGQATVLATQRFSNGARTEVKVGKYGYGFASSTKLTLPSGDVMTLTPTGAGQTLQVGVGDSAVTRTREAVEADGGYTFTATSIPVRAATIDGLKVGTFTQVAQIDSAKWQLNLTRSGPRTRFESTVACSSRGRWHARQTMAGTLARAFRDKQGRLICTIDGEVVQRFRYDSIGRIERQESFDGKQLMVLTLVWDDLGQETQRTYTLDGTVKLMLERDYHTNGQLKSRKTSQEGTLRLTETYSYDGTTDRLSTYVCSGLPDAMPSDDTGKRIKQQVFSHDVLGNLLKCTTTYVDNRIREQQYRYDAINPTMRSQITVDGNVSTLAYDLSGNLAKDSKGRHLQYNALGQLQRVTDDKNNVIARYDYDGLNRLIAVRDVQGQRTCELLYDAEGQLEAEVWFDKDDKEEVRTRFLGSIQQTVKGGLMATRFIFEDPHGGVIGVDGQPPIAFTPYGEHAGDGHTPLGYNGEWRDPVMGGYHLGQGARYYDPQERGFYQRDTRSPLGAGGLNDRSYCSGDPVNLHDPSGHVMLSRSGQESQIVEMNKLIASLDPPPPPVERQDTRPWYERMAVGLIWGVVGIMAAVAAVILAIPTGGASLVIAGLVLAASIVAMGLQIASEVVRYSHPRLSQDLEYASLGVTIVSLVPGAIQGLARLGRWGLQNVGKLAVHVETTLQKGAVARVAIKSHPTFGKPLPGQMVSQGGRMYSVMPASIRGNSSIARSLPSSIRTGASTGVQGHSVFGEPLPGQTVWQDGKKHRIPYRFEVWTERVIRLADPVEYVSITLEHGLGIDRGFEGILNSPNQEEEPDTGLKRRQLLELQQNAARAGSDYDTVEGDIFSEEEPALLASR